MRVSSTKSLVISRVCTARLTLYTRLGVPNPELTTDAAALRVYDGRGSVQLVAADTDQGILLMERVRPGAPLVELDDDEAATAIAADVMRQLWRPAPAEHPFPTIARWFRALRDLRGQFDGGTGPLSARLVETAETLFAELNGSIAAPVVLHGDLHHWNIVTAERQPWLAIDPKGLVGEPAYEVGALLHNPLPRLLEVPDPGRVLARRVDQLSEALGFDRQRMVGWGVAQAVLSACWSVEDHGTESDWIGGTIACAELLAELIE